MREIGGKKKREKRRRLKHVRESLVLSSGPYNFQLIYKKVLNSIIWKLKTNMNEFSK